MQTELLSLDVQISEGVSVVHVVGEIDVLTSPELHRFLSGLDGDVIVDLNAVPFLGASGLGVLVGSRKRLARTGGVLRLRCPQPIVRRVFEVAGMSEWFET